MSVEGTTAPPARPVPRARDAEPGRVRGHVRAAPGAARPVPAPGADGLPRRGGGATDRAPPPGGRRPARGDRARDPDATGCSPCATSSGPSASPTRSRRTPSRSCGRPAATPTSSSGRARGRRSRSTGPRRRPRSLAGRAFVTPDDVKAVAPAVLDPPARRRPRPEPARGDRRRRARRGPRRRPRPAGHRRRGLTDGRRASSRRSSCSCSGACSASRSRSSSGTVALLLEVVHAAWARNGLAGVRYRRELGARHVAFGDELPLDDRGLEPARACPSRGCAPTTTRAPASRSAERDLVTERDGAGRAAQRVDARGRTSASSAGSTSARTGVASSRSGPVELSVGDPFAPARRDRGARRHGHVPRLAAERSPRRSSRRPTAGATTTGRTRASPRTRRGSPASGRTRRATPSAASTPGRAPASTSRCSSASSRHATARCWSRSTSRPRTGPRGSSASTDDEVEALYVVAASVVRQLAHRRRRVRVPRRGLHGRRDADRPGARLVVARARRSGCWTCSPGCPPRLDAVRAAARASRPRRRGPGSTVLVLTARDPRPLALALRRIERGGAHVVVVACGRHADQGRGPGPARSGSPPGAR